MKINNLPLSILIILLFTTPSSYAQEAEDYMKDCPSDRMHQELLQQDADYAAKHEAFLKRYREEVERNVTDQLSEKKSVVYTLPLVIHVIHSGEPQGTDANPTDAYLINSINIATQRFRHTHSGANTYTNPFYGADTELEFCFAKEDPNGNYTSGIVRYIDPINTQNPSSAYLNSLEWDTDKYMNLFIAADIGNGIFGYYSGGSNDYTVFWANGYNTGLLAHEWGHYFSLAHTFTPNGGCTNSDCLSDGDGVCDTPPKLNSGFTGTPCDTPGNECTADEDDTSTNNPYRPVAMGGMGDQPDHLNNYMDYTGSCWDCFTEGQKTRMRTYIDAVRPNLRDNSAACAHTPNFNRDICLYDINFSINDNCDNTLNPVVTIYNFGTTTLNSLIVNVYKDGTLVHNETWTGTLASENSESFTLNTPLLLSNGMQNFNIQVEQPNGNSDQNMSNNMKDFDIDFELATFCGTNTCATINSNTNLGTGNTTAVSIIEAFPTTGVTKANICASFNGDASGSSEVFTVIDESNVSRGTTNTIGDCSGPSAPFCFEVTAADYNNWTTDGSITVTFDPVSSNINPNLCAINEVCASIDIFGSNCVNDMTLTGSILSGTYEVIDFIICSGNISSTESVILRADNTIDFPVGFEVMLGGELDANTQNMGCN